MDPSVRSNIKGSITIDDVNKLRILDPEVTRKSDQVRTECKDFIESTSNFQVIVDGFLSMIESLAQSVEKEKMKAIGASNIINSLTKARESQQIQLQTQIAERRMELERLRIQYQSLSTTQKEQQEYIDLLISCK